MEALAPVAKVNSMRVLLSLAANIGWSLQQFVVKNAFLHGDLDEEIYKEIPPAWFEFKRKESVQYIFFFLKKRKGLVWSETIS